MLAEKEFLENAFVPDGMIVVRALAESTAIHGVSIVTCSAVYTTLLATVENLSGLSTGVLDTAKPRGDLSYRGSCTSIFGVKPDNKELIEAPLISSSIDKIAK